MSNSNEEKAAIVFCPDGRERTALYVPKWGKFIVWNPICTEWIAIVFENRPVFSHDLGRHIANSGRAKAISALNCPLRSKVQELSY